MRVLRPGRSAKIDGRVPYLARMKRRRTTRSRRTPRSCYEGTKMPVHAKMPRRNGRLHLTPLSRVTPFARLEEQASRHAAPLNASVLRHEKSHQFDVRVYHLSRSRSLPGATGSVSR